MQEIMTPCERRMDTHNIVNALPKTGTSLTQDLLNCMFIFVAAVCDGLAESGARGGCLGLGAARPSH